MDDLHKYIKLKSMIASHDTYTYLKPRNPLMNIISLWWRCQKLDINKQYELGVRVFDVRVYRNDHKWYMAHGWAKFKDVSFDTLIDICLYFKREFPGTKIRIYLEDDVRDDSKLENAWFIKDKFLSEASEIYGEFESIIWEIGTHHPWVTYFRNPSFHPEIKEYYCHLFNWNPDQSFWYNIKHFDWSSWSLPYYARKHNPEITQEMIDDPNTMHLMDYIGIYPKK